MRSMEPLHSDASSDDRPRQNAFTVEEDPHDWSVWGSLSIGWRAVKDQPVPLIGGFMLVGVLQSALQWAVPRLLGTPAPSLDLTPDELIASLQSLGMLIPASFLFGVYLLVGQFRAALAAARGYHVELGMFFSGWDRLLPALAVCAVVYLGVGLGLLLLVLPGVFLALSWSLTMPLVADTSLGVGEIFAESWEATQGQRWRILLLWIASLVIAALGVMLFYVGVFVASPILFVAYAETYMCITGRRYADEA